MDNEIQSLLDSPLAEDRKMGLEMLADSSDPTVLKVLSAMHKIETDPEIKQMIIDVGKGIKRRAEGDKMFTSSASIGDLAKSKRDNAADWADDMASSSFDKPKRKNEFPTGETTWGTALMDVGLYGLCSGTVIFLILLLFMSVLGSLFETLATSSSTSFDGIGNVSQLAEMFSSMGFAIAIIYGLIVAVVSMIGYMLWFGIIHMVSSMMLGGSGSYTGMLHHASIPMIVWTVVSYGISIAAVYFSFVAMGSSMDASYEQLQRASSVNNLMSLINFLALIGFSFWLSTVISNNYRFGTGKGCASIIISDIVIFALACGCVFFFSSAVAQAFSNGSYQGFIPLMF
jgi:flagellar biogenesis protein FliO